MHLNDLEASILKEARRAKSTRPKPWIAAFDADGTLWNTDLGELFFDYQINNCSLKDLPPDPWNYYLETKKVNTPKAYLWLAQINKGRTIAEVKTWAEEAFLSLKPFPFLEFQKRLISALLNEEFEVYVVTASVKWAVEPGAKRLGIKESNVLGIKTQIQNSVVTDVQDGPITWRGGKADAILAATAGVRPVLCAGNTLGDLHLIELATNIQIAVKSQKPGEHLFETELELQTEAKRRNWTILDLS